MKRNLEIKLPTRSAYDRYWSSRPKYVKTADTLLLKFASLNPEEDHEASHRRINFALKTE